VAFSADGKLLASAEGNAIRLWNVDSGKEVRKWAAHVGHVSALAFSGDGKTLASGGVDCRVRLWDPATGKERLPTQGHGGPVPALAFSPDGKEVASGGLDRTVRFWDWTTGRELRRCRDVGQPLLGWQWGMIDVSYAPDGKEVVSAELQGEKTLYRVWETQTLKVMAQFEGEHTCAIGCAADKETLVTATWEGELAVLELAQGKVLRRVGVTSGQIGGISLSPDGRTVAWAGLNGGFGAVDLKTGKVLFPRTAMNWPARRVAFSPDSKLLATAGMHICLWEVATGKRVGLWQGMLAEDVAFSPDGRLLAASVNKGVALWDIATQKELARFTGHRAAVLRIAFAPNGRAVVSASQDGTLLVWDVAGLLKAG
jgi:WD40 repeat protein